MSGEAGTSAFARAAMTARGRSATRCTAAGCSAGRSSRGSWRNGAKRASAAGSASTPTRSTSTWSSPACATTRGTTRRGPAGPAGTGRWCRHRGSSCGIPAASRPLAGQETAAPARTSLHGYGWTPGPPARALAAARAAGQRRVRPGAAAGPDDLRARLAALEPAAGRGCCWSSPPAPPRWSR